MRCGSMSIWTALRLAGLGIEFDVGEAGADDQQRVAVLHRLLRGRRAQQADAAGGVGTVVGHARLAQQRLDDRRAQHARRAAPARAGAQRAAPARMTIFLPRVEDIGRLLAARLVRHARGYRQERPTMWSGHVALGALVAS